MTRDKGDARVYAGLTLLPQAFRAKDSEASAHMAFSVESSNEDADALQIFAHELGYRATLYAQQMLRLQKGSDQIVPASEQSLDLVAEAMVALQVIVAKCRARGSADAECVYQLSLCLTALSQHEAALNFLQLIEPISRDVPAVLALRGYLELRHQRTQSGCTMLALAAHLSRGDATTRNVLRFTQHALLTHQFGS